VKLKVLEAEWNRTRVVLKTPKPLGTSTALLLTNALFPSSTKIENLKLSTGELIYHVRSFE
jgi:hypothetical protein